MTRRELREHCFKLLFCADFYPAGETGDQLEQYFTEPQEEEDTPDGVSEVLHSPALDVFDSEYVRTKVGRIMELIPDLDARINEIAKGWTTKRMGKVELTDRKSVV